MQISPVGSNPANIYETAVHHKTALPGNTTPNFEQSGHIPYDCSRIKFDKYNAIPRFLLCSQINTSSLINSRFSISLDITNMDNMRNIAAGQIQVCQEKSLQ